MIATWVRATGKGGSSPLLPFSCGFLEWLSFESEVQRPDTEQPQQRERAHTGPIHDTEAGVLTRRDRDLERLPEKRIVRPQPVFSRCDLARRFVAEQQRGERLPVE